MTAPSDPRPFPRALLEREAPEAAPSLIGALLIREGSGDPTSRRVARIVEVEAYGGEEDRASHARAGRTARNAAMFADPGTAYVYLVYGMHHCLNVATGPAGRASAVLIRAAEPVSDPEAFRAARATSASRRRAATSGSPVPAHALLRGPGVLAAALGIDRRLDGVDLLDPASPLRLALPADAGDPSARSGSPPRVVATPRIGIGYAPEPWRSLPWRFLDADSPAVSGPRSARDATQRPTDEG